VTPRQLETLKEQLEGLDLDNDDDMDAIDGWDDLPAEERELLRQALKDGHVGDDVWKGVSNNVANLGRADQSP
jgi:hypothetical protein